MPENAHTKPSLIGEQRCISEKPFHTAVLERRLLHSGRIGIINE